MPGVPCPLANKKPGDIDMMIVRENTNMRVFFSWWKNVSRLYREIYIQETVISRVGIDRVQKVCL